MPSANWNSVTTRRSGECPNTACPVPPIGSVDEITGRRTNEECNTIYTSIQECSVIKPRWEEVFCSQPLLNPLLLYEQELQGVPQDWCRHFEIRNYDEVPCYGLVYDLLHCNDASTVAPTNKRKLLKSWPTLASNHRRKSKTTAWSLL